MSLKHGLQKSRSESFIPEKGTLGSTVTAVTVTFKIPQCFVIHSLDLSLLCF